MLKSRLDKPYSCFDGSCNPEHPTHWLKEFLDNEELDIYLQQYTIFDNPFLDPDFVEQLCKEYEGTIYYDRLILGLWKRAEGAIYKRFADNPEAFRCEVVDQIETDAEIKQFRKEDIVSIEIGIDFGGNQSGHSFVARGYTDDYWEVIVLKSKRIKAADENEDIDSNRLNELFCEFIREVLEKYAVIINMGIMWNTATWNPFFGITQRRSLEIPSESVVEKEFPWIAVKQAKKKQLQIVLDAPSRLMGAGRFFSLQVIASL